MNKPSPTDPPARNVDRREALEKELAITYEALATARRELHVIDRADEPFRQAVDRWESRAANLRTRLNVLTAVERSKKTPTPSLP